MCAYFHIIRTIYTITMFEEAKKSNRRTARMSVTILKTVNDKFNEHVEAVGYDKSRLVEKILEDYLNKLEK